VTTREADPEEEQFYAASTGTGPKQKRKEANLKRERERTRLERARVQRVWEESRLKRVREEARCCMMERGLMVCRSCAAELKLRGPALAENCDLEPIGMASVNVKYREAFTEWVAAANGTLEKVVPIPAVVETPHSRIADIFNRTKEELDLCGQAIILRDGRRGQVVTVARSSNEDQCFKVAFFREQGKKLSKGIVECEMVPMPAAFMALKRAQDHIKEDEYSTTLGIVDPRRQQ
jgi:hypothetical protein